MPLYLNPCSPQYHSENSQFAFNRMFLMSVVLLQIFIMFILRLLSGLKNNDIEQIKKQIEHNRKISNITVMQTLQNLNQNQNHNQNHNQNNLILTTNQSKEIKTQKQNPQELFLSKKSLLQTTRQKAIKDVSTLNQLFIKSIAEDIIKNAGQIQNNTKINQQISQQSYVSQNSSQDHQNEQNEQNTINSINKNASIEKYLLNLEQMKNSINIFNLKLSLTQFSTLSELLIANFFIILAIAVVHAPTLSAVVLGCTHSFFLVILIILNMCVQRSSKYKLNAQNLQNSSQPNKNTLQMQNLQAIFDNKENISKQKGQVKKIIQTQSISVSERVQRVLSLLLIGLIMTINISLLTLSIFGIKSSYYDLVNERCA